MDGKQYNTCMINPETAYDTYTNTCVKNKVKPISELNFVRGLVIGLSGSLSLACSHGCAGMTKYPVDNNEELWCLLVPCSDGMIRVIFGPKNGIDETIENISNAADKTMSEDLDECELSSIDQF